MKRRSFLLGSAAFAVVPYRALGSRFSIVTKSREVFVDLEPTKFPGTITTYISNAGAADYSDDEVWLEVNHKPGTSWLNPHHSLSTALDDLQGGNTLRVKGS